MVMMLENHLGVEMTKEIVDDHGTVMDKNGVDKTKKFIRTIKTWITDAFGERAKELQN